MTFRTGDGLEVNGLVVVGPDGTLRAPIFYDSSNTDFYVDPVGSSKLYGTLSLGHTNSQPGNLRLYDTGNNYLAFTGTAANTFAIDLEGTGSDGALTITQFNVGIGAATDANHRLKVSDTGHNYLWIESTQGTSEAMTRYKNPTSNNWYTGIRNTAQNSITNTGYHIYSSGFGATTGGWNASGQFFTANEGYALASFRAPYFYDSNDTTYYADPANISNFTRLNLHYSQVWNETTQGGTPGSLHLDPNSPTDHAGGAITFGASDTSNGTNAHAGIYVRSDGSYGTKMYLSTTDSYGAGSKTALSIDQAGVVSSTRSRIQSASDMRANYFYDTDDTTYYVNPASSNSKLVGLNIFGGANNNTNDATLYVHKTSNADWAIAIAGVSSATEYGLRVDLNGTHSYAAQFKQSGSEYSRIGTDMMHHGASIRSPIFYDSNNTAYYSDASSTGTSLNVAGNAIIPGYASIAGVELSTGVTRSLSGMANNEWVTIANFAGGRKQDIIEIHDDESSRHNMLKLQVGWAFGQGSIQIINGVRHGNRTLNQIRLLYNSADRTYGTGKVQVYLTSWSTSYSLKIKQQAWTSGAWGRSDIPSSVEAGLPSGYTIHEGTTLEVNEDANGTLGTTGRAVIGQGLDMFHGSPIKFHTTAGDGISTERGFIDAQEGGHLRIATSGGENIVFQDGGVGGTTNLTILGTGEMVKEATERFTIKSHSNGMDGGMRMYASNNSTVFQIHPDTNGQMYCDRTWFFTDNVRSPIYYDSNDTTYYVNPGDTTISGKFRQTVIIGDGSQLNTNDGGWGARLNLTDSVHSKIEIGQDSNSMKSHWYAHTGHTSIKFGTSTAHDVEIQRGGSTKLTIRDGDIRLNAPINTNGNVLRRGNHHTGHFEGSYNNIGANGSKSNPIYTIGSSYNPNDADLSNMYGIGFSDEGSAPSFFPGSFIGGWGLYVAADGDARVFLDGSSGHGTFVGQVRATGFYDVDNTAYYGDFAGNSFLDSISVKVGAESPGAANSSQIGLIMRYGGSSYNNNTWAHKFHKHDHGGGVPLYLSETIGTGNWSNMQRWGSYSGDSYKNVFFSALKVVGSVDADAFYDRNDTAYYGDFAHTSKMNTLRLAGHLAVGGHSDASPSTLSTSERITFGTLSSDAINNYSIGTTLENYGGNYNKLDLAFHTGIRLGAHPNYGGTRFYSDQTMGTEIAAIGKSGNFMQATNSMRTPIFYDVADTSYYFDGNDATCSLKTRGSIRIGYGGHLGLGAISNPKLAIPGDTAAWSGSGTTTGQIVIDLPGTLAHYDMLYMEVDVYEYSAKNATKIIVGGHNWNSGANSGTSNLMWHNVGVKIIGDTDKPIFFGWRNDGTNNRRVMVIGEPTSSWSYGTVRVSSVSGATDFYVGAIDYTGDWNVTQSTSSSYYTKNPTTDFNSVGEKTLKTHGRMAAYGYQGNGNVGGTGEASWHPSGIYSNGNNWLYGQIMMNNNRITGCRDIEFGAGSGHSHEMNTERANNIRFRAHADGASGMVMQDNSGNFKYQMYGDGTNYGFLDGTWGSWDLQKATNGVLYMNGNTSYYLNPASTTAANLYGDVNIVGNHGHGVCGLYISTRYQHVWSMGTAYRTSADGTSAGNMYGLTYTHTNVGTGTNQAISGLSHQLQHRHNGTLTAAIGSGIWTSGNVTAYSDIAVKTNLVRIPNALEKVCSINGYTYERTDYVKDLEDSEAPDILRQAGVVAQEIEKVLPEVVSGQEGNKAVAYGNIVALLIESIKELKDEVDDLRQQLKEK